MSLSRRALFGAHTADGSERPRTLIAARRRESLVDELWPNLDEAATVPQPASGEIRLMFNENPLGPGERALGAVREMFPGASRYSENTSPSMGDLQAALAAANDARPEHVLLGAGSEELLKDAVQAFTSKSKHMVTATPTYTASTRVAEYLGTEVRAIPLDSDGKLNLVAMAEASRGAGLVFVCNPNNPTATVHQAEAIAEFVERVQQISPETVIHFDEAYHEYVTDPGYRSALSLALWTPNIFVSRTFSKVYGLAGLRIGYGVGHKDTIAQLGRYGLPDNVNNVGVAAAYATFHDPVRMRREIRRNGEARRFTIDFFRKAGHEVFESNTNFIFVNIGRPAAGMRAACQEHGIRIGRDFPPMENTHVRISIGTMEQMQQATAVFAKVLA
jgi:histidinol-phosphate aminotransferase